MRIPRYYKLKIRVQTLLMAHAKTVAFSAKDCFSIPAKDETTSGLRKRNIEMRTQPAIDRSELLSSQTPGH